MPITGGVVLFEQSRKLAEYENRKAMVTFNVTDENGAEAEVATAMRLARGTVFTALGLQAPSPAVIEATAAGKVTAEAPAGKATKAEKAAKAAAEAAAKAALNPKPDHPDDPAAMTDPAAITEDHGAATDTADPLAFLNQPAEAAKPVTDKELTEAATRKNAALQKDKGPAGSKLIRALVDQYAPFPKNLGDIPADKRGEFLKKLGALA